MIASLPMYDAPAIAGANSQLWAAIRDGLQASGVDAPEALTRDTDDLHAHWRNPQLLFSQTCGLPLRAGLLDHVTLVTTPDYGLPGCPPGHYRSMIVARADDPRDTLAAFAGARFAYNDALSQSGWGSVVLETPEVLTGPTLASGGHAASAAMIQQDQADFAAIDGVSLRLLQASGLADGLKVVGQTRPTPGLAFITAFPKLAPVLRQVIGTALSGPASAAGEKLGITGLVDLTADDYCALPIAPLPAAPLHHAGL